MNCVKYSVLCLCLLYVSCEKEGSGLDEEISFGSTSNILISTVDTIIVSDRENRSAAIDLDIDGDNIADIHLKSYQRSNPDNGPFPYTEIICLHSDIKIQGFETNDTTFYGVSTSVYFDSWEGTIIDIWKKYSCRRQTDLDSIVSIEENSFKPAPHNSGAILHQNDLFKSVSVHLAKSPSSWQGNWYERINEDTAIYNHTTYDIDCNTFPQEKFVYIGLKLCNDDEEKLGWIKLSIIDDCKVSILETAIQEELYE